MYLIFDRIVIRVDSIVNCRIEETRYIAKKNEERRFEYAFHIITTDGNFGYRFDTIEEAIKLRDAIFKSLPHTTIKVPIDLSKVMIYKSN